MITTVGNTGFRNILLHKNIPAPAAKSMQIQSNKADDISNNFNTREMDRKTTQITETNECLGLKNNSNHDEVRLQI